MSRYPICDCKDFVNSFHQIVAAQELAANHGIEYTGKPIEYCPWCGEPLEIIYDTMEEFLEDLPC